MSLKTGTATGMNSLKKTRNNTTTIVKTPTKAQQTLMAMTARTTGAIPTSVRSTIVMFSTLLKCAALAAAVIEMRSLRLMKNPKASLFRKRAKKVTTNQSNPFQNRKARLMKFRKRKSKMLSLSPRKMSPFRKRISNMLSLSPFR